jgi:hypothetical protein
LAIAAHRSRMKIEFRNIEHYPRLSEETPCFAADHYVDGRLEAHVSNRGHGGGNDYRFPPGRSWKTLDEIERRVADLGMTRLYEFDGETMTLAVDLEMLSFEAVEGWLS